MNQEKELRGILKTDLPLSPEDIAEIRRKWRFEYGSQKTKCVITPYFFSQQKNV